MGGVLSQWHIEPSIKNSCKFTKDIEQGLCLVVIYDS